MIDHKHKSKSSLRPMRRPIPWTFGVVGVFCLVSCGSSTPEEPSNTPGPCAPGFARNQQGLCRAEACLMPGPMTLRTSTLGGAAATRFAVGETVVVEGSGFLAGSGMNTVTFDGVPASSLLSDPADPTRRLFAVVPSGIPGAPTQSGDAERADVCVVVQSASSALGSTSIAVAPTLSQQPVIKTVSPDVQTEGGEITVTGSGFGASAIVKIRDISAPVVRGSSTELVVTVPDFPDVLAGPPVSSSLKVFVAGGGQAVYPGRFLVRGQ